LDANRPREADIAAEPARSSGHLPSWARSWVRRQFDAGWLRPSWPAALGGRDVSAEEELIFLEEVARLGIVRSPNPQGLDIIAPSLRDFGDEYQYYSCSGLKLAVTADIGAALLTRVVTGP